jgi:hypothetical protein
MSETTRLTRSTDARRERGRLRMQLAALMDTNAPRADVEAVRTQIQQLNTQIEEQDGHR